MNVALFLVSFALFVLFITYLRQSKKLKVEYTKLQEDFSRLRNEQESFYIEIEKSNAELAAQATDTLTGLPERTAFEERLRQAISQSSRYSGTFALLSIDIDDFTSVDQGSPRAREELLVQISQRILSVIREADSLTRFAGSHFVLLLPHIARPESAAYVATRIQEAIMEPFIVENTEELHFTTGIGIAVYPLDGDTVELLLQKSGAALNEAKRNGKNKYHYWHQEIHSLSTRESQILMALRSPELISTLKIQYLPQVVSATEKMTGIYAEALMLHPTLGEIQSRELIRLAEHCGRATEIMTWLFEQAIEKALKYHNVDDAPIRVALTVSSRQIENAHFIFQMTEIVSKADPQKVEPIFEITDPPVRSQSSLIRQGFSTLSAANIHFAIYLAARGQNLPGKWPEMHFSYLKTDVKMIEHMLEQSQGADILTSLSAMTNEEGLPLVIENVNEASQQQCLQNLGFQILQGKLFEHLLSQPKGAAATP